MNSYYVGNVVTVAGQLADADGTPGDPGGVVVKYRNPAGAIVSKTYGTDPEVTRTAAGAYQMDITATLEGVWSYRFESSVSRIAASEGRFTVRESQFN
mgnify:CR=1 FL=1